MFNKLLSVFDVVHVHPNINTKYCGLTSESGEIFFLTDCLEITFLSKNLRLKEPSPCFATNPLDHNSAELTNWYLNEIWNKS